MNSINFVIGAECPFTHKLACLTIWGFKAGFGLSAMTLCWWSFPFTLSRGEDLFFSATFETPEYTIGSVDGQAGWKVDQGHAEVKKGEGRMGSSGLVLLPEDPFSQARLQLATDIGVSQTLFLDVYVRPLASDAAEKEEMIDMNSARIGVFTDTTTDAASIWVFDGDLNGGGKWVRTSGVIAIDKDSGRADRLASIDGPPGSRGPHLGFMD